MSSKRKKFILGRVGQFKRIRSELKGVDNVVWVHSSSFGEFEESRPVISAIKAAHPECRILVTFFSPSGYEHLKDDPIADFVYYLPLDFPWNAWRFVRLVHPSRVIVSISDYWLFFLWELRRRHIPTYLVSARYLPSMFYFKPLGFLHRDAFRTCFRKIFVKSQSSIEVLEEAGIHNAVYVGDPRMERVRAIAAEDWSDATVERWSCGRKVFVAGSTLPDEDDECLIALANANPEDKFLIVPHEIGEDEIAHLRSSIKGRSVLYSDAGDDISDAQVLIVDVVGKLSRIYRYGFASYVGGGFCGIAPHSVIEPAAYGIPVSFGPYFGYQMHCQRMIDAGAAVAVKERSEICEWYSRLKSEPGYCESMGNAAAAYCLKESGVAETIAAEIMA